MLHSVNAVVFAGSTRRSRADSGESQIMVGVPIYGPKGPQIAGKCTMQADGWTADAIAAQ